jgi:hypothetical protein
MQAALNRYCCELFLCRHHSGSDNIVNHFGFRQFQIATRGFRPECEGPLASGRQDSIWGAGIKISCPSAWLRPHRGIGRWAGGPLALTIGHGLWWVATIKAPQAAGPDNLATTAHYSAATCAVSMNCDTHLFRRFTFAR